LKRPRGHRHERHRKLLALRRRTADLRKSFGKTEIIRGANLAVAPGERVAIIGPNGAGKSTLFNLISGRFGPTSGQILLNGERIDGLRPYEINRKGLARSFQVSQPVHAAVGVREPALRGVVVAGLPLLVLEVPGRHARRQRTCRRVDGDDQARAQAATRWP
jgi:ABC-type branched-subunit amino acid transport system ATPase component